ncbi:MAG: hypothetical protein WDN69_15895 [Aliidongia sp.]
MATPTGDSALVRSEMATMNSRNVLQAVAAKLHLDRLPEFNSRLRPVDTSIWAKLDPRPWINGLLHQHVDGPSDDHLAVEADVESTLERNLSLVNDGRDYVINITYQSEDPALSAAIVNTVIHSYLEQYIAENVQATGLRQSFAGCARPGTAQRHDGGGKGDPGLFRADRTGHDRAGHGCGTAGRRH